MKYEYKVLNEGVVEVTIFGASKPVSLAKAFVGKNSEETEAVLNTLGEQGWEPVLLQPPFIFRKLRS